MPRDSLPALLEEASAAGIQRLALNGCWQEDWGAVLDIARAHPDRFAPNIGLHPWWVHQRSADWLQQLRKLLEDNPTCGLGEVSGLRQGSCRMQTLLLLRDVARPSEASRSSPKRAGRGACWPAGHRPDELGPASVQCGLDKGPRAKDLPPAEDQQEAFEAQLALAQELRRPVSVRDEDPGSLICPACCCHGSCSSLPRQTSSSGQHD